MSFLLKNIFSVSFNLLSFILNNPLHLCGFHILPAVKWLKVKYTQHPIFSHIANMVQYNFYLNIYMMKVASYTKICIYVSFNSTKNTQWHVYITTISISVCMNVHFIFDGLKFEFWYHVLFNELQFFFIQILIIFQVCKKKEKKICTV